MSLLFQPLDEYFTIRQWAGLLVTIPLFIAMRRAIGYLSVLPSKSVSRSLSFHLYVAIIQLSLQIFHDLVFSFSILKYFTRFVMFLQVNCLITTFIDNFSCCSKRINAKIDLVVSLSNVVVAAQTVYSILLIFPYHECGQQGEFIFMISYGALSFLGILLFSSLYVREVELGSTLQTRLNNPGDIDKRLRLPELLVQSHSRRRESAIFFLALLLSLMTAILVSVLKSMKIDSGACLFCECFLSQSGFLLKLIVALADLASVNLLSFAAYDCFYRSRKKQLESIIQRGDDHQPVSQTQIDDSFSQSNF